MPPYIRCCWASSKSPSPSLDFANILPRGCVVAWLRGYVVAFLLRFIRRQGLDRRYLFAHVIDTPNRNYYNFEGS